MEAILRSYDHHVSSGENKAWKYSGLYGIWTNDLSGAALDQLSWQANWELFIMLVPNKPMKWWITDCKYMKVIRVNCEQRNEYGSDLHGEYKARNRGLCLKNRRPWRMTKPLYLHKASLVLLQVIFFCPAWGTFRHGFLKIKRTTPLSCNEWVLHQIYSQKHSGLTFKKFTLL